GAERCFLMLRNEQGELVQKIARNWEQEMVKEDDTSISRTIIYRVANTGLPVLTTNAQEDPRFGDQKSIVAYNLRSILCVPLKLKSEITGVIYADNRVKSGLFTQKDLELLVAFSNQAAVAVENARLFASVRRTLTEVIELKNLMDNVFSSIASGVLTADLEERIMLCNQAASHILGRTSQEVIGHELGESLENLNSVLEPHLLRVRETDEAVIGLELSPFMGSRGQVDLRLSLTPLKDIDHVTQGVAIVMEDMTEKKRLEGQRRLFERMVSPRVIDMLDPNQLALGGTRKTITILFADIRSFTRFSEDTPPEELVFVLNRYLAAAADEILKEEGTVDKFLGDAVMSWFNAPIPQADHTLRAVRAAIGIRSVISAIHQTFPPKNQLSFGIGIHVGDAVLGLVGSEKRLEYTAIGDSVNTAKRIQENAGPGQIIISANAYKYVKDSVEVRESAAIIAKGKKDPIRVYEVIGLR
ncbi:MAG: GAF domain-containing protein, partial [Anaerolineaceae bacterium]|nr:GAF domain-containing protein [Anaerolineaceae bacterium]